MITIFFKYKLMLICRYYLQPYINWAAKKNEDEQHTWIYDETLEKLGFADLARFQELFERWAPDQTEQIDKIKNTLKRRYGNIFDAMKRFQLKLKSVGYI